MFIWVMISCTIAMPLALFRWRDARNNYVFGKIYGPIGRAIMGLKVTVEGAEHLRNTPAVFAVNHQSGIDLATTSLAYPEGAVIIGKKEVAYIPFFGQMYYAFGNLLIDRADRVNALSGLNRVVAEMKRRGVSVWIFPEGTRNASGTGLLPFKKGAFYMAIQSQTPLVPIVSSRLERLINFKQRYARSGHIIIRVLPPISTTGMTNTDVGNLLETTRNQMLTALAEISVKAEALDA
jgi:1-acyl-sn-glycerol-3-phosphate acyltransferase